MMIECDRLLLLSDMLYHEDIARSPAKEDDNDRFEIQ